MINLKNWTKNTLNFIFRRFGILLIDNATLFIIIDLIKILNLTKDYQLTISNLYDLIQIYKANNDISRNSILKSYYFNLYNNIYDFVKLSEVESAWDDLEWGDN